MSDELKLYLWTDVLCDHTCGMAVVLAHNMEEAIEVMKATFPDYITEQLPFTKCRVITAPDAFYNYGGG
jgi:hypothetical protein